MPCRENPWVPDGREVPALVSSGCYDKIPQTGRLQQQTAVSHGSGGRTSAVSVWADVVVGEGLLLGLSMVAILPHARVTLCV